MGQRSRAGLPVNTQAFRTHAQSVGERKVKVRALDTSAEDILRNEAVQLLNSREDQELGGLAGLGPPHALIKVALERGKERLDVQDGGAKSRIPSPLGSPICIKWLPACGTARAACTNLCSRASWTCRFRGNIKSRSPWKLPRAHRRRTAVLAASSREGVGQSVQQEGLELLIEDAHPARKDARLTGVQQGSLNMPKQLGFPTALAC